MWAKGRAAGPQATKVLLPQALPHFISYQKALTCTTKDHERMDQKELTKRTADSSRASNFAKLNSFKDFAMKPDINPS